jgi:hypothetical protein
MLTFKQFLEESQWMYHGSPAKIDHLKPNRDEYMIDRAVGSHFAADPEVSKKFQAGLHRNNHGQTKIEGNLYRTRAPTRAKLFKVPQKTYKNKKFPNWRGRQSDQDAIGSHIAGTVFSQPEHKHLFKAWISKARGIDGAQHADEIHSLLSKGKAPSDAKFGVAAAKSTNFHHYVSNFDSNLSMQPHEGFKREVVNHYIDHMTKKGYHGLTYTNTAPSETDGKVRSKKSYVIFHPEKHKLEKV